MIFSSKDVPDSDTEIGDGSGNESDSNDDDNETADQDAEEDLSVCNGKGFEIAEDVDFAAPEFCDMISDEPLKPSLLPAAVIPTLLPVSQATNTPIVWAFKMV